MIRVEAVEKRFGSVTALDGVTFHVEAGEILGFLGPNGAGKTTTLRILAGFLAADRGRVTVAGIDVAADPRAAQRKLGYLPESAPLYDEMRVEEYLAFRARLKDVPGREVRVRVAEVVEKAHVHDVRRRLVGQLSKGYRQRVGIADALLARPPVLLLDEPTAGLDPGQIRETRELLVGLAGEHTVLLSSHLLGEVARTADRVVVVVGGKVVAEERPGAIAGTGAYLVTVADEDTERAAGLLEGAEVLAKGRLRARGAPDDIARRLVAAGCALRELRAEVRTLEDVFAEAVR